LAETGDLPIIDAHQHFWDLERNYLPWLKHEPMIPFRYGDYSAIRKSYLPADYRRDTQGHHVVGSVYVEAEWDPKDPLGETRWVHELAAREGLPSAMVAQAWLDAADVEEVLAAQAAFPLVRSVRCKPKAAKSPDEMRPGAPGSLTDPAWRRGYALLERHGLAFDLQVVWWHLPEAAELAEAHPGIPVILNHTGLPADRSPEGLAGWRAGMDRLARVPHASVKISGLGIPGQPWTAENNRRVVLEAIEAFGVERCMFASNIPVDNLTGDFDTIFRGFDEITKDLTESERRALFHDNARRIYRLD
jgi:predicted TIM-barrel fold metal-dependent hydrolase